MSSRKTYRINAEPGWAFLVVSDIHFPLHDSPSLRKVQEYFDTRLQAGLYTKAGVILNGDILDCYGLSKWGAKAKKYWTHGKLMEGVHAARPFLEWASRFDLALYNLGNHELWTRRFVDQNPGLEGCPGVEFGALTGLGDIDGLEILDFDTKIILNNKVVMTHGHGTRGKTASAIANNYPDQVSIVGHHHRTQSHFRTVWTPTGPAYRAAHMVGMLCSDECVEDYSPDADMQRGFATVEFKGPMSKPVFSVRNHVLVSSVQGYMHVC